MYDLNFSGWVGSLSFNEELKILVIAEFSDFDDEIAIVNGVYKLTNLMKYERSIDFECVDINTSIEWRGKIWSTDEGKIKVEMIQTQSSRRWVNLSDEYGGKFLKEAGLSKLLLGI